MTDAFKQGFNDCMMKLAEDGFIPPFKEVPFTEEPFWNRFKPWKTWWDKTHQQEVDFNNEVIRRNNIARREWAIKQDPKRNPDATEFAATMNPNGTTNWDAVAKPEYPRTMIANLPKKPDIPKDPLPLTASTAGK